MLVKHGLCALITFCVGGNLFIWMTSNKMEVSIKRKTFEIKKDNSKRSNSTTVANQSVPCTADLVFNDDNFKNPTTRWGYSHDESKWRWQLSSQAQEACHLEFPFVTPLQSSPEDIQSALAGKWVVMIGDSSIRMLHDYLVGRWFGNYTHWPKGMDNHGPRHTRPCGEQHNNCHFDVYHRGARITYFWLDLEMTDSLQTIIEKTIGIPDVVVGQHGYHAYKTLKPNKINKSGKDLKSNKINKSGKTLKSNIKNNAATIEERIIYTLEQTSAIPKKITEVLQHQEMGNIYQKAYSGSQTTYKIWMSFFDKGTLFGFDPDHMHASIYDGTESARNLGWDIFDRSNLVNIKGEYSDAHPMNEILEVELELLLMLIRNLPTNEK